MNATDLLGYFKKVIRGLIITVCILIISIVLIVYGFLHYLSLYDFTDNVKQSVEDVETIENSSIEQHN